MARSYLWTEGNPTDAAKRVVDDLSSQIDHDNVKVVAVGTTGSARRLVGAILNATVVKTKLPLMQLAPHIFILMCALFWKLVVRTQR